MQSHADLDGSVRPYALTDHIHEREASTHLGGLMGNPEFSLSFMPTVAPWFSGIVSVLNAPLNQSMRASDIIGLYEEKYANEPLCQVVKGVPDVRDVANKHGWRVGGVQVHSSGNRVVVVVSKLTRFALTPGCARQPPQGRCDPVPAEPQPGARLRRARRCPQGPVLGDII